MTALDPFLKGLIDYAGLFPPAEQSMDEAVRNFAAYRTADNAAVLNRFVCPAQRMTEFAETAAPLIGEGESAWPIAALGSGRDDLEGFLANLDGDLAAMQALAEKYGARVRIDALEISVPATIVNEGDAPAAQELAARAAERIDASAPHALTPYFEIAFPGQWRERVPQVIAGIAEHNRCRSGSAPRCGAAAVKVRTGGVEGHMFPSVDQLTLLIGECLSKNIALKATAGLHHPVRHFSEAVGAKMHGFLNVFGAAILTHAHDLDPSSVACILEDESPEHFIVDGDWFRWQNFSANSRQIREARTAFAHSFGSCSFDEPLDDLRTLGLL